MVDQLVWPVVRFMAGILAVYFGNRLVRWSDARAKLRRDADYALRIRQLSADLAELENEKRQGKAAGE